MWPPPTQLSPAGAGGGGFQSRASASVIPAPPPPVPQAPPEPPSGSDPVWPAEGAPATSSQYGDWARRQRPQGTVYGGAPPAHDPAQAPPPGFEPSGSLAGHILAQGRPEESSASSKIVMIILIVMSVLVVGGLGFAIAYLSGVFH